MQVTTVSPVNSATADSDPVRAQAAKAGAQFEGILLNMVFGDLQRTFAQWPGNTRDAVSKSYDGFGMDALTSGLAASGGIGLGKFITRALVARSGEAHHVT